MPVGFANHGNLSWLAPHVAERSLYRLVDAYLAGSYLRQSSTLSSLWQMFSVIFSQCFFIMFFHGVTVD
jgi:hypothetical protein